MKMQKAIRTRLPEMPGSRGKPEGRNTGGTTCTKIMRDMPTYSRQGD